VARLKHPNIVGVRNVGIEDGIHFIIMDFIAGHDLKWFLDMNEGGLPISAAVRMFSQLCQGLHYAHENRVLHRDIKPGNILDAYGVPKITDFGFAKFADQDLSLTVSGAVMGTPYYLSPEQARDAKNVDRRSDIYSLGCTFYHAICGLVPFQGGTLAQILLAHQQEPVPDPRSVNSEVPGDLAQIIMKMMAKNPANRFESAAAVHRELAVFASSIGHRN
jgi:serine/threonine protein kinase